MHPARNVAATGVDHKEDRGQLLRGNGEQDVGRGLLLLLLWGLLPLLRKPGRVLLLELAVAAPCVGPQGGARDAICTGPQGGAHGAQQREGKEAGKGHQGTAIAR